MKLDVMKKFLIKILYKIVRKGVQSGKLYTSTLKCCTVDRITFQSFLFK